MKTIEQEQDNGNQKRGLYISIGIHVLLLCIAFLPLLTYPDPPPEKEGILVNFGAPDQGEGNDQPQSQPNASDQPSESSDAVQESEEQEEQEAEAARLKPEEKMMTEQDSEVKIKKQAEKSREQSEAEKKAEAEAQRKAAAEAARKAKEAEAEKLKSDLKQAFSGAGKGNTGKPGSQGDPNGDPNSDILEGISTGKGEIGGGLSDRGVEYEPAIKDQSQKTGRVVMKVCVNPEGDVISAEYTQRGSTTTDSDLKRIAQKAVYQFKFSPGDLEKQCGTITIDFKVE
jgi:TonB family protein